MWSTFGNRFLQTLLKLHRVVWAGKKIRKRRPKAKNANKEKKKARPNFVGIHLFLGNPRKVPMFLRGPEMFLGLLQNNHRVIKTDIKQIIIMDVAWSV